MADRVEPGGPDENEVLADDELTDAELRAADGRVPGRRGRATRQRLLACTADMLGTTSFRELRVVDIAREAGTSPATFYQYFPDVEAAILVLAEEVAQEAAGLADLVRGPSWKGRQGWAASTAVADGFMDFWERHRAVMRVVELAAGEGDQRFHRLRTRMLNPLATAFTEVVDGFRKEGRQPADLDPMAVAGVLVSMLAHVAAHRYGFEFWGIRSEDTTRTMARIIFTTVTGQKPPADV
ncbi:MAG: TetR/AcrR family transcriptional regulator [Acidimicrobiales bacterium]|nr:TetR/AcrR family transcriptional regulator [Acidimicrobiales bacterium]